MCGAVSARSTRPPDRLCIVAWMVCRSGVCIEPLDCCCCCWRRGTSYNACNVVALMLMRWVRAENMDRDAGAIVMFATSVGRSLEDTQHDGRVVGCALCLVEEGQGLSWLTAEKSGRPSTSCAPVSLHETSWHRCQGHWLRKDDGSSEMALAIKTGELKLILALNNYPQEEEYANRLIQEFKSGLLPLTDGTTLRTFLSKLLNCDPMRISKKFVGSNCIGKQVRCVV